MAILEHLGLSEIQVEKELKIRWPSAEVSLDLELKIGNPCMKDYLEKNSEPN